MGFTAAAYSATINEINTNLAKFDAGLEHVRQVANRKLGKIPLIGAGIKALFNKLVGLIRQGANKVRDGLRNAQIPMIMDKNEEGWLSIFHQADGVSTTLAAETNKREGDWKGLAGGAYSKGVSLQPGAANTMSSKATAIRGACTSIKNAGYLFFLGIAGAVFSIVGALITASTVIGPVIAAGAFIISLATALAGLFLNLAAAEKTLEEQSAAGPSLPGRHWPTATQA